MGGHTLDDFALFEFGIDDSTDLVGRDGGLCLEVSVGEGGGGEGGRASWHFFIHVVNI